MKLTILGSGTTVPSAKRSAPAHLLEAAGKLMLFDSGEGAKRRLAEAGQNPIDIDYFFYTHTHVDHVSELPALLWGFNWHEQPRTKELKILALKDLKSFILRCWRLFGRSLNKKQNLKCKSLN